MEDGPILKYTTLKDWPDYLKANPFSSTCQLVTKNGKVKLNTFILAAISPFLEQLLSTLPPYIEACIILPDIEWTEVSQFLDSISNINENLTLTKSLAQILGIHLNNFKESSIFIQSDTEKNIVEPDQINELKSDQDQSQPIDSEENIVEQVSLPSSEDGRGRRLVITMFPQCGRS